MNMESSGWHLAMVRTQCRATIQSHGPLAPQVNVKRGGRTRYDQLGGRPRR